jgi:hypothetical protein
VFALSQFGAAAPNDLRLNIGNIDLANEFAGTFAANRGDGPRATRAAPRYAAGTSRTWLKASATKVDTLGIKVTHSNIETSATYWTFAPGGRTLVL